MIKNQLVENSRIANYCICCGSRELKKSPAILMPFVAHRVFDWKPVEITDDWGLNTIKNGWAYTVCNSVQCNDCNMIFLDIRFSDSEMAALYNGYREQQYTELREKYEPGYKERNSALDYGSDYIADIELFLSQYLSFPINVLDWGGDTGKNTPFKSKCNLFHIYDISNKPVIEGAKKVDKSTADKNKYDLVVCSNVLEHVPYPTELILDIKTVMSEDTLLYLEIPLEDIIRTAETEINLHEKKKHWHEHINFYTEKSIHSMLKICGLDIIDLQQLQIVVAGKSCCVYLIACKLH
jgi:hypothetical protein